MSVRNIILKEIETFDEVQLYKLLKIIKTLSYTDKEKHKLTLWTEEYKTQVLGSWQGELKREVDTPPETRIMW